MLRVRSRGLLLMAAVSISMLTAAHGATFDRMDLHREAVDEQRYPWSSIGKLYNETGGSCSGVVISHDKILTAAHCLFNYRTQRFIPASALHFLVGYRTGRYSAHARIVSYEIGTGFDPSRYIETSGADWAVLTVTERLPADIEPLRLRRASAPSGTRAVLAGYGQDRAFALTADRDCELRDNFGAQLLRHTCRSTNGYSGAPILVSTGGREVQVAGIQIATAQSSGGPTMLAVPAQSILLQERRAEIDERVSPIEDTVAASEVCTVQPDGENAATLHAIQARLDFDATVLPSPEPPALPSAYTLAWLSFEPFAASFP